MTFDELLLAENTYRRTSTIFQISAETMSSFTAILLRKDLSYCQSLEVNTKAYKVREFALVIKRNLWEKLALEVTCPISTSTSSIIITGQISGSAAFIRLV